MHVSLVFPWGQVLPRCTQSYLELSPQNRTRGTAPCPHSGFLQVKPLSYFIVFTQFQAVAHLSPQTSSTSAKNPPSTQETRQSPPPSLRPLGFCGHIPRLHQHIAMPVSEPRSALSEHSWLHWATGPRFCYLTCPC